MRVPLFDMALELASVRGQIDTAIARVLDSGVFIGGAEVSAFERELATATGSAHAIGVSSGTDALHVIYLALGIATGDEVVTTPLTFFATAGSAARLGARIVFADIDDESLTLDPRAAASACSARTRAVVAVNLFGALASLGDVRVPIIEDAAQSIGTGPPRGIAAAYSFFPTKNVGALGDAGAVVTNDSALADRITLLRTHGARPKYHHHAVGGNFRIDALQAAILRVQLSRLAASTAARRSHAADYRARFAAALLPPELRLPVASDAHVYHQFVIRAPHRDALATHLRTVGVDTEIYYPMPLHLQPCFADLGYRKGSFPIAERACSEVLALPIHPTLTAHARAYVVEQIAAFYRGR